MCAPPEKKINKGKEKNTQKLHTTIVAPFVLALLTALTPTSQAFAISYDYETDLTVLNSYQSLISILSALRDQVCCYTHMHGIYTCMVMRTRVYILYMYMYMYICIYAYAHAHAYAYASLPDMHTDMHTDLPDMHMHM